MADTAASTPPPGIAPAREEQPLAVHAPPRKRAEEKATASTKREANHADQRVDNPWEVLSAASPEILDEIQIELRRQADAGTARLGRIETKAVTMLATIGGALAFIITLGMPIFWKVRDTLWNQSHALLYGAMAVILIALVLGVASGVFALQALRVQRTHTAIGEATLLNKGRITKFVAAENDDGGRTRYRRYLVVQMVQIVRDQWDGIETKARNLKRAENMFIAFVVTLAIIVAAMLWLRAPTV